nr:cyclic peptide export ABC transporter [Roseospira navarrensis]
MIDFIRGAPRRDLWWMLSLALVSGLANALLVVAVTEVTDVIAVGDRPGVLAWGGFIAAFLIYYVGNRVSMLRANRVIERLLKALRARVMDRVRQSELPQIDRMGRGRLYTLVAQETNHLSVTFPLIVDGVQQAILLVVSLIYLGILCLPALLAFLAAVAGGLAAYRLIDREFRQVLSRIHARQAEMLDAIANIIHGGKELRLNRGKSDAVLSRYRVVSDRTRDLLELSGETWTSFVLLSAVQVYVLLGVVGLVFPGVVPDFDTVIFQVIPVLLFCMGPLVKLGVQWPLFSRADVGLRSILQIQTELARADAVSPDEARRKAGAFQGVQRLDFDGLTFSHRDDSGEAVFTAGPFNLGIDRGETVFLVGGNGSGKSTVLRLIVGLIFADAGRILVDGRPVHREAIAGYRELFSAIFVDFHLFDRLYGVEAADPNRVNALIEEMGLAGKVSFENGRFSCLSLSTGQRKRLALIAALLEDRPVYVFDEWSAEQDVRFRAHFYHKVLPDLKARGKTVIAVTHDDRFWQTADRVVKMDLGRVIWERPGTDIERGR